MDRRKFNQLCSGLVAGAASLHAQAVYAQASKSKKSYPYTLLVLPDNSPLTVAKLPPGEAYIFSYPYVATPCFLVRLPSPGNNPQGWPGGAGPDQTIVAFSAICSHKMSHPARSISHINYRAEAITYYDKAGARLQRPHVITCCSEGSVFDPAANGKVLTGPAAQPLAAIALEVQESGQLAAIGSMGSDQYERFLTNFGFRLALEYDISDVFAYASDQSVATLATEFSRQRILC